MNSKTRGSSANKPVITMKPVNITATLDELRELKREMNEMKSRMKSQSLDIQYIKDIVDKMSEQVAMLAPKTLQGRHFPIKTTEELSDMHRRITAEKDAKFASQIFSELRMMIQSNGGINSDLRGCFESILVRDLSWQVNWSGYNEKKALKDHWLFKFCLPKILEVDPEDSLEMKNYETRIVAALVSLQHRRLAQIHRKRKKTSGKLSAKKTKKPDTDDIKLESVDVEFLDDSIYRSSEDEDSITGI